ncbi:MAG: hypothetical protein AAF968_03955 [Pseudomonadota bacterium]
METLRATLEDEIVHPFDTHPPTVSRLRALGVDPDTLDLDGALERPTLPSSDLLPPGLRAWLDAKLTEWENIDVAYAIGEELQESWVC